MLDMEELARIAYKAYGDDADWRNYRGDPMPDWENLTVGIQSHWKASVEAVAEHLANLPDLDD